jgi:Leucine-rich repeat (LRR) protein
MTFLNLYIPILSSKVRQTLPQQRHSYASDAVLLQKVRDNDASLTKLEFVHANLSQAEVKSLSRALYTNTNVTELSIVGNIFCSASLQALLEVLICNKSLTTFVLSHNLLTESSDDNVPHCVAAAVAPILAGNHTLTELALDGSDISDDGFELLIKSLPPNISKLDLSDNKISNVTSLANFLKANTKLKVIELWENRLGNAGAICLWEAMAYNSTLEILSVGRNGISEVLHEKLQRLVS